MQQEQSNKKQGWRQYRLSKNGKIVVIVFSLTFLLTVVFQLIKSKTYSAHEFGFSIIKSEVDFNNNGRDDYKDFVRGAHKAATSQTVETDSEDHSFSEIKETAIDHCTNVIWRAFKEAGYSLQQMVEADIRANLPVYAAATEIGSADSNYRRVQILRVFFDRYAQTLSNIPTNDLGQFQPGDIIVYGSRFDHIGIVSDKRSKEGIPYLIHDLNQKTLEEDVLLETGAITRHYRFNAKLIAEDKLIAFEIEE